MVNSKEAGTVEPGGGGNGGMCPLAFFKRKKVPSKYYLF
jgi:hypothetical protein